MKISRIENIQQFDGLKTAWESVYASDPHAHIFVSWTWLRGWFEMAPYPWSILAAQPDDESPYVAFFPLSMRAPRAYKFRPIRLLHMGSWPLVLYTGFVCLPEHEKEVLAAFARYIQQQLGWDTFQMEYFLDPRLDLFLKCFPHESFNVRQVNRTPCLYVSLPDNWDCYLQNCIGAKTRRNLRRSFRQIESQNEFKVTRTQKDVIERDIEVLLSLWQLRWGPSAKARWHRAILHYLFENRCLWLSVLWHEQTPVAALAGIIDRQKSTFHAYITGYDTKYARLSPGKAMFGLSIRYAIENSLETYDFSRGIESYKLSFKPVRCFTTYTVITRRSLRSTIANLCIDLVRQVRDLLKKICS